MHLIPHQGVGGLSRFVIEVVRHERMDGANDEIVLTQRAIDKDRDFLAPATPVHFLPTGLGPDLVSEKDLGRRLADLCSSRGGRAIHVYTPRDLAIAATAKRRTGDLMVVAMMFEPPRADSFLARRRVEAHAARADVFAVASPALAGPWERLRRDVEVWPPAVDTRRFSPQDTSSSWRRARLPDPEVLLVGSMMRAEDGKRQDVLMEAVRLRNAQGGKTALMMVGDGPRFDAIKQRTIGSDVLFARRRVLDGPGFFSRIDVFALHSDAELVPMSLIESMSCGRAAVVADRGAVEGLVGKDVVRCTPPADPGAVVRVLDEWAHPEARAEVGRRAREQALSKHALGPLRGRLRASYA